MEEAFLRKQTVYSILFIDIMYLFAVLIYSFQRDAYFKGSLKMGVCVGAGV